MWLRRQRLGQDHLNVLKLECILFSLEATRDIRAAISTLQCFSISFNGAEVHDNWWSESHWKVNCSGKIRILLTNFPFQYSVSRRFLKHLRRENSELSKSRKLTLVSPWNNDCLSGSNKGLKHYQMIGIWEKIIVFLPWITLLAAVKAK